MTAYTQIGDVPLFKYGLIMADPPWLFNLRTKKGEAKSPQAQYDCMSLEAIKEMRISNVAARDCWLWLWAINPMLPQAFEVMEAWGFSFVTAGHWVKRTKHGKLNMGTGYVLRGAGEPFLIGKLGNPESCSRSIRSVIDAPIREHSRKPDAAYEAAEKLAGRHAFRLDLFSREERPGWDRFGNETEKFTAKKAG